MKKSCVFIGFGKQAQEYANVFQKLNIKISSILKFKVSENVTFVAGNERIAQVVKEFFPRNKIMVSLNPSNMEMLNTLLN